MLKFSNANAKIRKLAHLQSMQPYLKNGRKIYSLDLLSGWSCPYAKDCLSKVYIKRHSGELLSVFDFVKNTWKVVKTLRDGPDTQFRCFSASQEVLLPYVYDLRKHNLLYLREQIQQNDMWRLDLSRLIESQLPKDLGILRIHVGGDFFHQTYFDAMALVAHRNPDKLFYAYTKSLLFWVRRIKELPSNFVLTASRGGKLDHLIDEHNLRESVVIDDENLCAKIAAQKQHNRINKHGSQWDGWAIDHDDSHAANPNKSTESFALLLHGVQPKGTPASKALSNLKGIGGYSK